MSDKKTGMLIVLSGPSGVGKDSVLKLILKERNDLKLSISYTTRPPRHGEVNGIDYHFVSKEEFEELINDGEMLEYATYCGNYYGTRSFEIDEELAKGNSVILEIEVQGAGQVIKKRKDAVSIFIVPSSIKELENRLVGRGLDSKQTINNRILAAEKEIERKLGRTQKSVNREYHDRMIDIDILLYDDLVMNTPELTIPHPLMYQREVVMKPLSQIAPELVKH